MFVDEKTRIYVLGTHVFSSLMFVILSEIDVLPEVRYLRGY